MKYDIVVNKTQSSRLQEVDFDKLQFGRIFSDHMFVADYLDGEWTNIRIEPFGPFSIHPAAMALHYGQAIFEGMKASKSVDNKPMLFRPEMHAKRINATAQRMCMPDFPEELFQEAVYQLVGLDSAWIPPQEGSALYIRPFMFAIDGFVGVRPSDTYKFMIITSPVGPYYARPVRLYAETEFVRAVKGGTGEAKAAGNYAAALLPAKIAKERGYDQVMWLDGHEFKYIQEVGTMNIFFVIDDEIITPSTDGAILKGITRESIMTLLRDNGHTVVERPISIDEVLDAYKKGKLKEVFGSGTAAVVAQVAEIAYKDNIITLPPVEEMKISTFVKEEINAMRAGKIKDTRGWIVPVETAVEVNA